ncbi:MAG: ABC transporter substrate-binding protein [Streptosporangiaceae bacterium]
MATWSQIPAAEKAADGTWYGDYGGYVAIGYDTKKVKVAPTSFKDLLKPIHKSQVAINGNPAQASAAFSAVYAAALANGGSLSNIEPGIEYFAKAALLSWPASPPAQVQARPARSAADPGPAAAAAGRGRAAQSGR